MTSEMETTFKYTANGTYRKDSPSSPKKGSACNLQLKNLILKKTSEEVIDNFYDPNLKLYIYPLAWSNQKSPIQCPRMTNDEWAESARMIVGENNSRELIEGNIPMVSLPIEIDDFEVNLLLLAITFKDKGIIKYKIFDKFEHIVRKSDLNKFIKLSTDRDTTKIDELIEELKANTSKLSEYIDNVECLIHYHNTNPRTETTVTLNNQLLQAKITIDMSTSGYERSQPAKRSGMPDLNGQRLVYEPTRGSLDDLEKIAKPVRLTNSVSGNIEAILFALPATSEYSEREHYLNIVRELVQVMFDVKVIILIEMTDDQTWQKQVEEEIKSLKDTIPQENNIILKMLKRNMEVGDESFSAWVQDAVVVGVDEDNTTYLLTAENPKREDRRNDGSIASRVAEGTLGYTLRKFDFQLEGGNMLVADDFILIGKDEVAHNGKYTTKNEFLNKFKRYIGDERKVIFVETEFVKQPKPEEKVRHLVEQERTIGEVFSLKDDHRIYYWRGDEQPIFHLDVFITLLGYKNKEYEILIGEPIAGFDPYSDDMPDDVRTMMVYQLDDAKKRIDECIKNLKSALNEHGISPIIHRNPLPLTFVNELGGYFWYWATYNNCIIQNGENKTVWLPTYGYYHKYDTHLEYLKKYDLENKEVFKSLGFKPHLLNTDFNFCAQKNGSLHCLSKTIKRNVLLTK